MTDVSHETLARLCLYAELLVKWQKSFNLVGPRTLDDIWTRHFLDSAQLAPLVPAGEGPWLDFGSGAGFPGMVLAIMGHGPMHLVESNGKKVNFLREVARQTKTDITIFGQRIEQVKPFTARVISARALAPLAELLDWAAPFTGQETLFLLPKGQDVELELTQAAKCWSITAERFPSRTAPNSTILRLHHVHRTIARARQDHG